MQGKVIGLVYEITGNPYFGTDQNKSEDRISEFPKPQEVNQIARTLKELGFGVEIIDGPQGLLERSADIRQRCSLLFNKSIGFRGLERKIAVPAVCQLYNLPLLGSTAYGMTLARHKYHANRLLAGFGIRVPNSILAYEGQYPNGEGLAHFRLPVIVKPNHESDSLGIDEDAVCGDSEAVKRRVRHVHERFHQAAVVEEFIGGEEWSVAVLGNRPDTKALGCAGVLKNGKRISGSLQTRLDAIGDTITYYMPTFGPAVVEAMECAVRVHELFGLRDYSRCDFRLDENGAPFCMEVSTHPDLDSESSFAAAAMQSISCYREVIGEIVRTAMAREPVLSGD
ncbi:MAG TPA: hypothetical protein VL171_11665 [Verrucomicrobiae bacterium]|nr:hypothetical protein [Verrucomicrobiae bacterium]